MSKSIELGFGLVRFGGAAIKIEIKLKIKLMKKLKIKPSKKAELVFGLVRIGVGGVPSSNKDRGAMIRRQGQISHRDLFLISYLFQRMKKIMK